MDSVFLKIWQFPPHPFNCRKFGRVQLSSNFLLFAITNFTLTCEIWKHFFKNVHQKWKYYREEKQDFERFFIFLNTKTSGRSNEIELSEEFMVMWKEEQPSEVFRKKGVLRNFAKFRGKHLCQSLFFNKAAGLAKFLRAPFLTSERLLPKFENNVNSRFFQTHTFE